MGQPLASLLSPGSNALASGLGLPTTILSKWSYVEQRLTKLLVNIQITEAQVKNGATSHGFRLIDLRVEDSHRELRELR